MLGYGQYAAVADRLRGLGFVENTTGGVICRWDHPSGLVLDVMPTDAEILGFSNDWYRPAFTNSVSVDLPSGARIRAVSPPYLLATKIEAFRGRGRGDFQASVDFEDIVRLVDTRSEVVDEIEAAEPGLRMFVAGEVATLLADGYFEDGVSGALPFDAAAHARLPHVMGRFRRLAAPR